MNSQAIIPLVFLGIFVAPTQNFEEDVYPTGSGDLKIVFIGHGSLMFEFNGTIIQVDPVATYADYIAKDAADLIL
ncbi:MAG: MBL fold metallo-hydrolase, partial [bacterium]